MVKKQKCKHAKWCGGYWNIGDGNIKEAIICEGQCLTNYQPPTPKQDKKLIYHGWIKHGGCTINGNHYENEPCPERRCKIIPKQDKPQDKDKTREIDEFIDECHHCGYDSSVDCKFYRHKEKLLSLLSHSQQRLIGKIEKMKIKRQDIPQYEYENLKKGKATLVNKALSDVKKLIKEI